MKLKTIIALTIILGTSYTLGAQELKPLTRDCFHSSAAYFGLKNEIAALYGIFATEGGTVGEYSTNENGSRDNGPMQINSTKIKDLTFLEVNEEALRNDGCYNVFVSAHILNDHYKKSGNIWQAVGDYHSKTKEFGDAYILRVWEKLQANPDFDQLIAQANKQIEAKTQ